DCCNRDHELRQNPVVAKEAPLRAERLEDTGHQGREAARDDDRAPHDLRRLVHGARPCRAREPGDSERENGGGLTIRTPPQSPTWIPAPPPDPGEIGA